MNRKLFVAVLSIAVLAACAEKGPVLMGNVKYLVPEGAKAGAPKTVVGVSPFKDLRGKVASVLGKRTIGGDIENDLVVQGTVADLATIAFKDALRARGVVVKDAPSWDLKPESASGEGCDIIVGGEIRSLWVDVVSQPLSVEQKAEVSLRVSAVSLPDKAVVKTLTMNSKAESKDIAYSQYTVEGLLSEALTKAIDQFLKDDDFSKRIQ